jgi:SulP family sulfate permease
MKGIVARFLRLFRWSSNDLSLQPLMKDIRNYSFDKIRGDGTAAVAVGMLSIPQAIAYSIVAGVSPSAGLVAMMLGTLIAAFLSSSSHLVIGPNNATSLLVQAAMAEIFQKHITEGYSLDPLQIIASLTLLIGAFQVLAALFKLGRLIQFVSHSVVVGYIAGTACAISVGQLFPLLGMACPDGLDSLYQKGVYWVFHLWDLHTATACVGVTSLLMVVLLRRTRWRTPAALTMLVLMTALVYVVSGMRGGEGSIVQLVDQGDVPSVVPAFEWPFFDLQLLNSLLPIAFAIAVIGMLETNSIARTIASITGQRLSGNQETFALGCANFSTSFFGALPSSGSVTRSSINLEAGAQTRFSAILSCGIVALFVFVLGSVVQYVPRASLAALLMATALRIIDPNQIKLCWRSTNSDALVFVATFFSCVFFTLPLAFYIGVVLSIILYLRKAASPRVVEYHFNEETGELRQAREEDRRAARPIRIINVEGELFFGAMDLFQGTLRAITGDDATTKVIILRLKHVHDLDATTALALRQLKDYLQRKGRSLVVCSVPHHVLELLNNAHLINYLGEENVISFDEKRPHDSMEKAMERAKVLLQLGDQ